MRALATALLVAAVVCLVSGAGLAGGDDRNVVLGWDESLFPVDDSGSGLTTELVGNWSREVMLMSRFRLVYPPWVGWG